MDHIYYDKGHLVMDGVSVSDLAKQFGTPLYVYSRARIEARFTHFRTSLNLSPNQVCYGVKANTCLAVLQVLAELGAGFDVVSGGELELVFKIRKDASSVVFSGVGKTRAELRRSLELGVRCINIESEAELNVLTEIAHDMQIQAPVSLRVNPDIDARTHPYIATSLKDSKFGIDLTRVLSLYERIEADDYLNVVGIDCHLGSQMTDTEPLLAAADLLVSTVDELAERNIAIRHIDLGGGFGIRYRDESLMDLQLLADALAKLSAGRNLDFLFEPGRYIVGDAGILLAQVLYTKRNGGKHFTIVDAAMNDFLRPALYRSWHDVLPESASRQGSEYDTSIVGPVCESGDFLALDRALDLRAGDLVAVTHAGAYGFVMSSNYNSRFRAAEVMISQGKALLVRARETLNDLVATQHLLPSDHA